MPQTIYHAVVARGTVVLSEYSSQTGNFAQVTDRILEKVPNEDTKLSYQFEKYLFHFIKENGLVFLCMTEESFPRRVAFAFLTEVKEQFHRLYEQARIDSAPAYGLGEFSKDLAKYVDYYSQNNVDRLQRVQNEVDSVKQIMVQNIGKVLERGERIEILVDKTETLNEQAFQFKKKATQLKRKMWWKNQKMLILCTIVVSLVIYVIVASACGGLSLPCLK
eukprot:comp24750_c0_seq1/m.46871 comp24750_c0_seq1/g.46871  ORF comp24750_c0_seq1/g.46871 comp24750_c0_seq1/m.46871 type:complete len:220 (-) comp24750_c0_seq1:385-1044(-)